MTAVQETTERIPEFSFGERLAKARKDAGLTQREMAEKLGVASVAQWENDSKQPRHLLEVVHQWAEITSVSEVWLLQNWKFPTGIDSVDGEQMEISYPTSRPELRGVA